MHEVNYVYHGFRLQEKQYISEIGAEAYLYEHETSGAKLFYIAANDDNKVFSVTFRTPPTDSTGVAHIAEHSVLCGSRKFPLKEPFVELVKGSLNTFLNAMTFPDKTMYPVASLNDKDFRNLMDVYLDAVFYPRMVDTPEILMQEGWHYELAAPEEPITYKGVVYNEMKGVYSSPDALIDRFAMQSLFPDTTYGVDSGGDPEEIIHLTFEDFVSFYKKYYHPSNSYLYLYGNMNIDEQLTFLHEAYLKDFSKMDVDSSIAYQMPFTEGKRLTRPYNAALGEDVAGKTIHSLMYALPSLDTGTTMALEVLNQALIGSPAAPLRRRLIEAGIGDDVSGDFTDGILQPVWAFSATGSDLEKAELLRHTVEEYIKEVCEKGIPKRILEAALNSYEFQLREASFGGHPSGLFYNIYVMNQWLYDKSPFEPLRYEDALKTLREGLETTYYTDLLQEAILNNTHHVLLSMYPKEGLTAEKEEKERTHLEALKKSLTKEEIDRMVEETRRLKERQEKADSKEALSTIPLLALSDLSDKAEGVAGYIKQVEGMPVHCVPLETRGIGYSRIYFDLADFTENELFYVALLTQVLGRMDTEFYTFEEIDQEIGLHLGGFQISVEQYQPKDKASSMGRYLMVAMKSLSANLFHQWRLLDAILGHTKFTDKKRFREIVNEIKSTWDMEAFSKGHTLVMTRLLSMISPQKGLLDLLQLGFYERVTQLVKEEDISLHLEKMKEVLTRLYATSRAQIFFGGSETDYDSFMSLGHAYYTHWKVGTNYHEDTLFTRRVKNQGITSSGQVQYVGQAINYKDMGYTFTGSMRVLEMIMKYEYLWSNIRVRGGAYGAMASFTVDGEIVLCSYRDPNLQATYEVYEEAADFIKEFDVSEREMRKYIIGTMSGIETPLTPSLSLAKYVRMHFTGYTAEDMGRIKREIIATKKEDIQWLAPLMAAFKEGQYRVTLGSQGKVEEAKDIFTEIVSLPS